MCKGEKKGGGGQKVSRNSEKNKEGKNEERNIMVLGEHI